MTSLKDITAYIKGGLLSYAQIYFSNSLWLGAFLMLVSFFDLGIGASGIIAIIVCQLCSLFFNFNKANILDGSYTYNAAMVGLAMGGLYQFSTSYIIVLVIASMLCFFLTVFISGRLSVKNLPFLSLPFLITIWILFLGLANFSSVQLISKETYLLQSWFPGLFINLTSFIDRFYLKDNIHIYLRSLSAVVFQYNDFAGLLIAIALLIRSRMAFMLSLYGYIIGYFFYTWFSGDFTPLIYSYIGFNFILSAIALGGFFLVPSVKSHLLLLFIIPVTAVLLSALYTVFNLFHLPLYSLPFNIIVLLTVGALQMRQYAKGLDLIVFQQYSPELNHYKHIYYQKRFSGQFYHHLSLPVIGEWHIPQGYEGDVTHKEGWKHALDFDITDEHNKTFNGYGLSVKDYYCYDLPVTAAAAGYVTNVKDGINDNAIGEINIHENWGNTIIIKHAEGLYTKLSHLKANSIKVKEGNYVNKGEIIAYSGSSGRSPEPHLHFQVQALPYIGAQTIACPIAYYLEKNTDSYTFHSFDIPQQNRYVRNVNVTPILANVFDLIPGKTLNWTISDGNKPWQNTWQIYLDIYNKTYIYCEATKAIAYFYNDGVLFYFTDYYGSRDTFLFRFYTAFQKILLGCYKGVTLTDWLLPQTLFGTATMAIQDVFAPFFHFIEGRYQFKFGGVDDYLHPENIIIETRSYGTLFNRQVKSINGKLQIDKQGIKHVEINLKGYKLTATCTV